MTKVYYYIVLYCDMLHWLFCFPLKNYLSCLRCENATVLSITEYERCGLTSVPQDRTRYSVNVTTTSTGPTELVH